MKTFTQLIEAWEHPFTGKDYHDDNERDMNKEDGLGAYHYYADATQRKSYNLADHYSDVAGHVDYDVPNSKSLNEYVGGSRAINSISIAMHKHPHDFHPGIAQSNVYAMNAKEVKQGITKWHNVYDDETRESYTKAGENTIQHVKNLDEAMQKIKTPHDMHVYSGLGFHPLMVGHERHGKAFGLHLPAFTSTSLRPSIALKFAKNRQIHGIDDRYLSSKIPKLENGDYYGNHNHPLRQQAHVVKIHIPEGSAGVYVGHGMSGSSLAEREAEFILPRKSKLIIGGKTSKIHVVNDDSGYPTKRVNIWHAKLVHDGFNPTRHMDEFK